MQEISAFWSAAIQNMGRIDFSLWADTHEHWKSLQKESFSRVFSIMEKRNELVPKRTERPVQTAWNTVTLAEESYPQRLRHIPYPPPVLFYEGSLESLEQQTMGIVGTRRCSPHGRKISFRMASRLSSVGFTIVSGLAFGIDEAAHAGTLRKGRTIAVLAHGLAVTSPRSHGSLRRDIVENGGVIISAWPDNVPPRPFRFPIRNRWIAGLSDQLIVIEAPLRSGALGTAQFATEWGRPVWAVPGGLNEPVSAGCNRLIADGAGVIWDVNAALEYWSGIRGPDVADWLSWVFDGVPLDVVAKRTGQTVVQLLATLSRLEVSGQVVRLGGNQYVEGHMLP